MVTLETFTISGKNKEGVQLGDKELAIELTRTFLKMIRKGDILKEGINQDKKKYTYKQLNRGRLYSDGKSQFSLTAYKSKKQDIVIAINYFGVDDRVALAKSKQEAKTVDIDEINIDEIELN